MAAHRQHSGKDKKPSAKHHSINYGLLDKLLGYLVRRAQLWVFRDVNHGLRKWRLDVVRFSILALVSANPGMRQRELSHALGSKPTRIVALVDELERRGLVERRRSNFDRRSRALHLTVEGRHMLKVAKVVAFANERKFARRIGTNLYRTVVHAFSSFRGD